MYKICVVTGTRADYGILKRLLVRLRNNNDIDLDLVVTGSHLSSLFGNTQSEIQEDGFSYSPLPIPIDDDSKSGMVNATGKALIEFTKYFNLKRPDILLILGDRFEILASAIAAHMLGIFIAHISGGDVTEGAVDDAIRHCITKMSQLHFPGCEQSRKRLIQMGEEPDRVFNVGELGVENCLNTNFMTRDELAESIHFPLKDYSVVTFHPVTMENNTGQTQLEELIKAMDSISGMDYIITMANADAGGRAINEIWLNEGKKHNNWLVVPSLGVIKYLSALKYAKLMIGNSSSGVVEAPSIGIPTINIGDRQKGRMMADSVICCEPTFEGISNAILQSFTSEFQEKAKHVKSPFGDGSTSYLIEKHLIDFLNRKGLTTEKRFFDISFEIR